MPSSNPIGWPDSSAAQYCKRLAVISRPFLCSLSAADRKLLPVAFIEAIKKENTDKDHLSDDQIALALYKSPPLQARLAVITQYTTSKWLLEQELKARGRWARNSDGRYCYGPEDDAYLIAADPKHSTVGLCLSGGGIRSATFALGVLQGLAREKLLSKFDYLSSVSGGGYIHQFLAAWIYRTGSLATVQDKMDPLPNCPEGSGDPDPGYATVQPEPIRWLRRYSNYLAPQKGLFSADSWTLVAIIVRNASLNLFTLISMLLAILILPHIVISQKIIDFVRNHHLLAETYFSTGRRVDLVLLVLAILVACMSAAYFFWPTANFARSLEGKQRSFGSTPILGLVIVPLIFAVAMVTPTAYRSIVSYQPYTTNNAPELFSLERNALRTVDREVHSVDKSYIVHTVEHPPNTTFQRLADNWDKKPAFPVNLCFWQFLFARRLPHFIRALDVVCVLLASFGFSLAICLSLPRVRRSMTLSLMIVPPILLFVTSGCAAMLLYCLRLFMFMLLFFVDPELIIDVSAVLIPLLLLGIPCIVFEIVIGLIGSEMEDAQREWLARLRAFTFLAGMLWLGFGGFSLLGPWVVSWIATMAIAKYALLGTWATTTVGGVLAGKSSRTNGSHPERDSPKDALTERLAVIAPPVFACGLLLLLSALANALLLAVSNTHIPLPLLTTTIVASAVAIIFGWRVDINDFSMQPFYRDRIARCYAGASDPARAPDKFSGFSGADRRLRVADLLPRSFGNSDGELWKKHDGSPQEPCYEGPFPVFCTAINLTMGEDLAYQERKAASFAFTPLYSGYSVGWTESEAATQQFNGFIPTTQWAYSSGGGIAMATAVATSGAAVSPNSGYHTNPAVAFLLTMFNVRLGWWIRNPRRQFPQKNPASSPVFGIIRLVMELCGAVNDTARYVYLTDGGHFDNMGLYELVRRRCRTIVICDGEQDTHLQFDGLGQSVRKIRLDFGVEIDLKDVCRMKNDDSNPGHVVIGSVIYPEDPAHPGTVIYIKTSLDGDEPVDIINYKREDPSFPQDTTLNQFFTESRFESYRTLGAHIATHPTVVSTLKEYLDKGGL
jgi:hypothetical protein